ncbi:MAG TPA: glycosyltransferase [Thermoanaerobaculia bacterium]|nr:glycosyltransferase [Thermoanaerobaculia bacterium]
MNILFITTKLPWPLVDGGRVLVHHTLTGLVARDHRITLVCPTSATPSTLAEARESLGPAVTIEAVPAPPRNLFGTTLRARLSGLPLSITRHQQPRVRERVAQLLERERFDVVHVEQPQALSQAEPAFARGVRVVLRAENVESDVWAGTARVQRATSWLFQHEARRLARWEGEAVARVAATAALTDRDAARLAALAGGRGRVVVVRAPFPAELPAGTRELPGQPAVVLYGSGGWLPNGDAARWFTEEIWPAVRAELPETRLHLFGAWHHGRPAPGILQHEAPADSREAFAPGAILVLPLRIASGVRIRILEAWARGLPVVATPEAVAGLDAEDGRELLVARDAVEFTTALRRLGEDPGLTSRLITAGRTALARGHDLEACTVRLEGVYRGV